MFWYTIPTLLQPEQRIFVIPSLSLLKGAVSSRAHLFCAYIKLERTGGFFKLNKSKMASARVGTHGGKRDNSGRKRKYQDSENFSSQNKPCEFCNFQSF
jgi:hypothetical protein